jgi:hypothetical protein
VTVTFPDGTSVQGEALDATGDQLYAIVRLAADAPAEAVALAPGAPGLGAPVAVLARARATVDQQTLSMGRVVSAGEAVFHIDAAVGDASLGAPVADPEGRLLGVVVGRADGFSAVVPSPVFADLKVAELDPEGGDWVTTMASGGMMGVSTDRTMTTGLYSGFRLVGWDQLQLDARIGILFDDDLPADDTTHLDREKVGAFVDLLAGYRFNLMPADLGPLQLTLSAGGTLQQFGGSLRHIGQGGRIVKTDIEESWVRPAVQVGLRMLDVIEFNYTMDINPDDIGASSHRIGFGIGF